MSSDPTVTPDDGLTDTFVVLTPAEYAPIGAVRSLVKTLLEVADAYAEAGDAEDEWNAEQVVQEARAFVDAGSTR